MRTNSIVLHRSIIIIPLALMLLLSACNASTANPTQAPLAILPGPAEATANPTATEVVPTQTPEPTQVTEPTQTPTRTGQSEVQVTVDLSGVAQDITSQVVPAVAPSPNEMWWAVMPQYTALTLQGHPVTNHDLQPQIFAFPVEGLAVNQVAGEIAQGLQILLQNQQVGKSLPYLPLYNSLQAMHAQVKFLDFKNGQGVRFLTQYNQGPVPINNSGLIYTFQGLTSDGKYYLAVVLPVTNPELPADTVISEEMANGLQNTPGYYAEYLTSTITLLDQQSTSTFTPDLSQLDAMVQSIEIK
jgi:hypothetical protein